MMKGRFQTSSHVSANPQTGKRWVGSLSRTATERLVMVAMPDVGADHLQLGPPQLQTIWTLGGCPVKYTYCRGRFSGSCATALNVKAVPHLTSSGCSASLVQAWPKLSVTLVSRGKTGVEGADGLAAGGELIGDGAGTGLIFAGDGDELSLASSDCISFRC